MSAKKLHDKVAIITGASKGLGKAMALALAEAGAKLALVSRDLEQLKETAVAVREFGTDAEVFTADVTDEQQVGRAEASVIERFGKPQILVNNAGINIRKPVTDFTLDEWRQVMDTNLTGAFLMSRSFVPHMKGQSYGRIINLTSIMSHVALPGRTATEMNVPIQQNPEMNRQFIAKIPLGRWGKPEEIGSLAVYLCSEEASFITGTDFLIDGGWTAQ